jgi:Fe2+ or Zn2+ uptake regulation protein
MTTVSDHIRAFRRAGRRITPQRRLIFHILAEETDHLTAEEVFQRAVTAMPDVSRSTVYNTLNVLVEIGQLHQVVDASGSSTRYDTNVGAHHHLCCLSCGALIDIERSFPDLELPPEKAEGYQVVKRQVTFYGYCPECRGGEPLETRKEARA